ncbi:hypothetical protein JKP88DRAFT_251523 [Tribonema minus]|uniref:Uncharacterized protein n=1 Tax=Tribonema minus TaxID=303371 RepID=A0A835ZEL9_9STRA|nr:hypothetical protein JKP88DRAFT_251523 [Tribonema minus]
MLWRRTACTCVGIAAAVAARASAALHCDAWAWAKGSGLQSLFFSVASAQDLDLLHEGLACTQRLSFNVTWTGHIAVAAPLTVKRGTTLTISGRRNSSRDGTAVIDGQSSTSLVQVTGGALHLDGLQLTGGTAQDGGAISAQGPAVVSLTDCELIGNRATSFGGALWLGDGVTRATLRGCALRDNAAGSGGAVYAQSQLSVAASVFTNNTAMGYRSIASAAVVAFGGAIVAKPGALQASNTTFENNTAAIAFPTGGEPWSPGDAPAVFLFTGGGAVFIWDVAAPAALHNCTFSRNAVRVAAPPPAAALRSVIGAPAQQFGGGALWSSASLLELHGCSFEANVVDNSAAVAHAAVGTSYGGAVYVEDGAVAVAACDFTRNGAAAPAAGVARGGAVYARNSTANISGSTFSGNVAANPALFSKRARNGPIDAAFINTEAVTAGGGVYFVGAALALDGSTFRGNRAHSGGGLCMSADAEMSGAAAAAPSVSLSIRACRFTDNWASVFGGAAQLAFDVPPPRALPRTALRVARSDFERNAANTGGALQVSAPIGSNTAIELSDVAFTRNDASFSGALDVTAYRHRYDATGAPLKYAAGAREPGCDVRLSRCRFLSNAAASGGALTLTAAAAADALTANGCDFSGNAADARRGIAAFGGAMLLTGAAALRTCTFDGNAAGDGGGAVAQYYTSFQSLDAQGCAFVNNTSGAYGGAIYAYSPVTVLNSTFRGNAARLGGGAIWGDLSAHNVTLARVAFDGNAARQQDGGALLWSTAETLQGEVRVTHHTLLTDCAFARNAAARDGGAVRARSVIAERTRYDGNAALAGGAVWSSSVSLDGCEFDGNTANSGGAVLAERALQSIDVHRRALKRCTHPVSISPWFQAATFNSEVRSHAPVPQAWTARCPERRWRTFRCWKATGAPRPTPRSCGRASATRHVGGATRAPTFPTTAHKDTRAPVSSDMFACCYVLQYLQCESMPSAHVRAAVHRGSVDVVLDRGRRGGATRAPTFPTTAHKDTRDLVSSEIGPCEQRHSCLRLRCVTLEQCGVGTAQSAPPATTRASWRRAVSAPTTGRAASSWQRSSSRSSSERCCGRASRAAAGRAGGARAARRRGARLASCASPSSCTRRVLQLEVVVAGGAQRTTAAAAECALRLVVMRMYMYVDRCSADFSWFP